MSDFFGVILAKSIEMGLSLPDLFVLSIAGVLAFLLWQERKASHEIASALRSLRAPLDELKISAALTLEILRERR